MLSRRVRALSAACLPLVLFGAVMFAQQSRARSGSRPDDQSASSQSQSRTGEQVFMANCSRCHNPPMTLSPRITGTIIMHMRVRARLSQQDEKLLLKFLAP
jgi:cytochrome c5